jgi:hypothetical protein
MQERDGGGPDNETPVERMRREVHQRIQEMLDRINQDRALSQQQKAERKERLARDRVRGLEQLTRRGPRVDEEEINKRIFEIQKFAQEKVFPHIPEVTEKALIALAATRLPPRQAIVVGTLMNELITSPQFRAQAGRTIEQVRENIRRMARRLRNEGANELADQVEQQVQNDENPPPNEPPPPPRGGEGGGPEGGDRGRGRGRGGGEDNGDPDGIEEDDEPETRQLLRKLREKYGEKWLKDVRDDNPIGFMSTEFNKSLVGIAVRMQIQLRREHQILLRAFDGGKEFKAYFQARQEMMAQRNPAVMTSDVYNAIKGDVKDIVTELLSTLEGTADSSKKEIQFVTQILNDKIVRIVSRDIQGDPSIDQEGTVEMKFDTFLPTKERPSKLSDEIVVGGMREYVEERVVRTSLSGALEKDLAPTIIKLTKLTYGVNNARLAAYTGSSHEDLNKQIESDGLKPTDLVWLFKKDDDVRLAYNFFMHSLEQLKAQTGRTITERYGAMSKNKLTEAEERTRVQLLASDDKYRELQERLTELKGIGGEANQQEIKRVGREIYKIQNRKLRAVKLASGVAWGFSKEAWGIMLDARLLVGQKEVEGHLRSTQHYGGSQQKGLEKMLAELHPKVNDERWGRDKAAPIWMLYQPRFLDMAKQRWARKEVYAHTRLYELHQMHDKAFYSGRPDDLADFDDDFITLHEFANITSLHLLKRGGWRVRQYERYMQDYNKEARDARKTGMDFHTHIIRRLMIRGGPRLVQMYIDDNVKEMMKLEGINTKILRQGELAEKAGKRSGLELNFLAYNEQERREKKAQAVRDAKAKYYKEFIFDDLEERFATSFIAFEQPRYMPEDEDTLYKNLNKHIQEEIYPSIEPNVLQTDIYPLFIDAVHLAERHMWEKYYRTPEGLSDDEIVQRQTAQPRRVDLQNLDPELKKKLKAHFELYKENIGRVTGYGTGAFVGDHRVSSEVKFEDYLRKLQGFNNKLQSEIAKDRYNRTRKNRSKKRQSLSERYANMLVLEQGGVDQMLGGSHFDFTLEIHQGGSELINRLNSDTMKAVEMTKAWDELAGDGGAIEQFVAAGVSDDDKKGLEEHATAIAEKINEVCKYPHGFSPDLGNEYKIRHEIFWGRALSKPEVFRGGIFGNAAEHMWRGVTGGQTNLFAEYYKKIYPQSEVTSLDGDQLRTVLQVWQNKLRVPRQRFEVEEYESVEDMDIFRRSLRKSEDALRRIPLIGPGMRDLARTITAPITEAYPKSFKTHKFHQDQVFKELSARHRDVVGERIFSIQTAAMLIVIMLALYQAAKEKNKEGSS